MSLKILDVGQCGFDGPRMARLFKSQLDATVESVSTAAEAKKKIAANKYNIVLVNRVLDGDRTSGIELIEDLARTGTGTPLMLVSDREDAQDQAVAKGAVRGFGKAELGEPEMLELIKSASKP
jgi:DNA-binding response OmpR family regulator